MPQMAPLSWLLLFIVFSTTLVIFNIMNYYSILPSSKASASPKSILSNSFNWKW